MCVAKDYNITDKEFLFCQEYVACHCNGTQAYINVYGTKNKDSARSKASQLLAKVNVRRCKDDLVAKMSFNKQAIINEAIQNLINIANGEADEETIIKVGSQQKKIKNKSQLRDRLQATELLMKLYNAFDTTSNQDEDADVEALKDSKNNAKNENVEIKELEDESE